MIHQVAIYFFVWVIILSRKLLLFVFLCTATLLPAQYKMYDISSSFAQSTQLTQIEPDEAAVSSPKNPVDEILDEQPPEEFHYWHEFFKMMLILGAILGSVLLLAWFLKKFLNKRVKILNHENTIKILERRNLSQKSMLYVVEVSGKQLLISDSQNSGVQLLSELHKDTTPAQSVDASLKTQTIASKFSFSQILQRKFQPSSPSNLSNFHETPEDPYETR